MYYQLYIRGKLYSGTKYENLEEAKSDAEYYNGKFPASCGRVYVCDKFQRQMF